MSKKDKEMKFWLVFAILGAIFIAAVVTFPILLSRNCSPLRDWITFFVGLLSFLGASTVGLVALWQGIRLSRQNREFQQDLARAQIDYGKFIDFKRNISDAVDAFDMPMFKLCVIRVTDAISDIKGKVKIDDDTSSKLNASFALIYKTKNRLLLDNNLEYIDKEHCANCKPRKKHDGLCKREGSSDQYQTMVRAAASFRDAYLDLYNKIREDIALVLELIREAENFDNVVNDKIAIESQKGSISDASREKMTEEVSEKIQKTVQKVRQALYEDEADAYKMFDDIYKKANKYIRAFERATKMNFNNEGWHPACDDKLAQLEEFFSDKSQKD